MVDLAFLGDLFLKAISANGLAEYILREELNLGPLVTEQLGIALRELLNVILGTRAKNNHFAFDSDKLDEGTIFDMSKTVVDEYGWIKNRGTDYKLEFASKIVYLEHSFIEVIDENRSLLLHLGHSDETKTLVGQRIKEKLPIGLQRSSTVPIDENTIPTFKITMVGGRGSGKTVFMVAMHEILNQGVGNGIRLNAIDDAVGQALHDDGERLFSHKQWPIGTSNFSKFLFSLNYAGKHLANIDWVDFEGGLVYDKDRDIDEPTPYRREGDDRAKLLERLKESHAVIWMVDMTPLGNKEVFDIGDRFTTGLNAISNICQRAAELSTIPKAWVFVRTKADTVQDRNGKIDWHKGIDDFKRLIGNTAKTLHYTNDYPLSLLMSLSSVGQVKLVDGEPEIGVPNPAHVQWPLIFSLAAVLHGNAQKLEENKKTLADEIGDLEPSKALGGLFQSFATKQRRQQIQSHNDELVLLTKRLAILKQYFVDLKEDIPPHFCLLR